MKTWQAQLGFFGGIAWLAAFGVSNWLIDHNYNAAGVALFGYIMGVVTGFAGHIFYDRILQGRWNEYFTGNVFDRFISGFSLLFVFSLGFIGFLTINFKSNPTQYIILFLVGGVVASQGIVPIINEFDKR